MAEKNYISAEGAARLRSEYDQLLTVERPRVVNQVAAAAAEGDRSENAEYIYGKKRLREIDRRLGWLDKTLDALEVVAPPARAEVVVFLSWVRIEDAAGRMQLLRIVGQDETDAKLGHISWRSPVGRALLKRRVDDQVIVETPGGRVEWTVVEIDVQRPE
ncbi:MAG: transcription elongation factor GreB [Bradymonadia bacterium]